jgi:hypothetical protein
MKNGTIGSLMAVQPVFAGGQIINGNKLAKVGEEVSRLQLQLSENEVEKTAAKASRKAKETVKAVETKVEKKVSKTKAAKLEIIVQSPMGGNITAEEIAAKVPAGAESVFVRVDQNKLWWIKGEETGSVDIWE